MAIPTISAWEIFKFFQISDHCVSLLLPISDSVFVPIPQLYIGCVCVVVVGGEGTKWS